MARLALFLIALLLTFPCRSEGDDAYALSVLRGMKTAAIFFTEKDTKRCQLDRDIEKRAALHLNRIEAKGLRFVSILPGSPLPDASILLMLEASDSRVQSEDTICNIFVKFEVFHQMPGRLRYSSSEQVLRVLAYRTFHVGSAPRESLSDAARRAALSALESFEGAYDSANR